MMTSSPSKSPFSSPIDEDVDYQAKLLGTAKVEMMMLVQTSASLHRDGYDADATRRIEAAAGVAGAHLGDGDRRARSRRSATKRIALVSPYSVPVNESARAAISSTFGMRNRRGRRLRRDQLIRDRRARPGKRARRFRPHRPAGESTPLSSPAAISRRWRMSPSWEAEFKRPVVTTNQALIWAMLRHFGAKEGIEGLGRLLDEVPAG